MTNENEQKEPQVEQNPDEIIESVVYYDVEQTPEAAQEDGSVEQEPQQVEEVNDQLEDGITISAVIEAVLFAADEAVTAAKLVEILGVGDVKKVKDCIQQLNQQYEQTGRAFRIEAIAGGFQMLTISQYNPWLSKLIKVRGESKLTAAAMETLAIIAYKQPIMRVDIEKIRGVAAGEMIRQLIDKGLVKIAGRAEELGRPILYGTTRRFLELFGLNSLKDLPQPEDKKNLIK